MLKASDMKRHGLSVGCGLIITAALSVVAVAQEVPDLRTFPKYQTPVPYEGIRNWHVTQNLGPTGARGWFLGRRGDTSESREILVKSVEPGSPAEGVLEPFDLIIGVPTKPIKPSPQWTVKEFESDARLLFADAITYAETHRAKGELTLIRLRNGVKETVTIKLPVMGSYSDTAPFDCPKTDKIVDNAAAFLAANMPADGYFNLPGALNALLLYATEDDRYLDHVRRTACRMSLNHEINDAGHETWRWGYMNMFLCEYYLATGDKRVLPTIKQFSDVLAAGQCNPGTWGHRAVPDFIPPGYGSLNQSGLVCFLSLVLSEQIGVPYDFEALRRSIEFYGSFAGKGAIPYGDHPPGPGATGNGKNGIGAVAFGQLGAGPVEQWFARLCASTNLREFEGGHTGNFFNQTWSPLGASLAGRENYIRFWSRFNSYRDMARRADGSFVTQPWPHTREGDLGTGNYVRKGPMWTTGGYALSYLADTKRLAILGRRDSVFAANPPTELNSALELYHQKQFAQCIDAADRYVSGHNTRLSRLAKQLRTAAQRNINSLNLTLADMDKTLALGNMLKLKAQVQAIESIIDLDDPRVAPFVMAVNDLATDEVLAAGRTYDRATKRPGWAGPLGCQVYAVSGQVNNRWRGRLESLAKSGPPAYRALATDFLKTHPKIELVPTLSLLDGAARSDRQAEASWRILPQGSNPEADWFKPKLDDSRWQAVDEPGKVRAGKGTFYLRRTFDGVDPQTIAQLGASYSHIGQTVVYINGTKVLDAKAAGWPSQITMMLKPITRELLKKQGNVIAVAVTPNKDVASYMFDLVATFKAD